MKAKAKMLLNTFSSNFSMVKKKECVLLSKKARTVLEAIAKIANKKEQKIASEIIEHYAHKYAEEQGIGEKAVELYVSDKISFEQLKLIIGKEKANAAKLTKRIRKRSKELLDTLA